MTEEQNPRPGSRRLRYQEMQERAERQRERFYELVVKALDELPPVFADKLDNLDIVVADWPSASQLGRSGIRSRYSLLGLYEGVPHTRRGRGYGLVLPDKITVFRKPIESRCRSWQEIEDEIASVVLHEIAHHFGTDEETLRRIEGARRGRRPSP